MQKAFEHGVNNSVSPATIELLIGERSKGKTLRQMGKMFDRSHESIRQLLSKYDQSEVTLLAEYAVAANLRYPVVWLTRLRKEGIIKPLKRGFWLYSEEQVRQIPSLIAEARKCKQCGKPRPFGSHKFCRECSQYRKKHPHKVLSREEKTKRHERYMAWRKANPERWNEIQSKAMTKYQAKCLERTY